MNEEYFNNIIRQVLAHMKKKKMSKAQKEYERQDCLSEETICDYLKHNLSVKESDRVEGHLSHCPFCRKLIISEMDSGHLEEPTEEWAKKGLREKVTPKLGEIMTTIAEPLKISLAWIEDHLKLKGTNADYLPFWEGLKPALVRGGSKKKEILIPPIHKKFKNYKVKVKVIEEKEGRCQIGCHVSPLSEKKEVSKIKVELIEEERLICAYPLKNAEAVFKGISPGKYTINIREGESLEAELFIEIWN